MNEKQIIEYYKSVLTPINVLEELNQMIYDFHNICSLVKFPYITDGGVLLGAVKYGTIIRYDDDFDASFIYTETNKLKLQLVFKLMKQLGYKVYYQLGHGGYQIVSNKINKYYPFIDVFPLYEREKGKYYFSKITATNPKFKRWRYWTHSQLFPRKLYKLGSFKIWGPHKVLPYLDQNFPEWETISHYQGNHSYNHVFSLVIEYASEDHPKIESDKLPLSLQKTPNLKLKYDTFKKLKVEPELLCKRKWFYIFKSSQLRWSRFYNEQCEKDYGVIKDQ